MRLNELPDERVMRLFNDSLFENLQGRFEIRSFPSTMFDGGIQQRRFSSMTYLRSTPETSRVFRSATERFSLKRSSMCKSFPLDDTTA